MLGPLLAAEIATQAPAHAAASTVVANWTIEQTATRCFMNRRFGDGDNWVIISFQPAPAGTNRDVLVVKPSHLVKTLMGDGWIALEPNGKRIAPHFPFSGVRDGSKINFLLRDIDREELGDLTTAPGVTLSVGGGEPIRIPLVGSEKAFAALQDCRDVHLRKWGVDPDDYAPVVVPPQAIDAGHWITTDDYPVAAVKARIGGTTEALTTISATGAVTSCQVIASSGNSALDGRACDLLKLRGRYAPARDENGKPVASLDSDRIVWLP